MSAIGNPDWPDNWTRGDGLRIEIMDTATSDVWLCQTGVDRETARALVPPEGFRVAGVAAAVADEAYFARSPGAASDGPLDTMEVDGLRFSRVARPRGHEQVGPLPVLSVEKHHTMRYGAGRTIHVIDRGDGTVLTPAWSGSRDDRPSLPEDWSMVTVALTADLVARVQNPATVVVLADGSGFHGPIPRPTIDEATR